MTLTPDIEAVAVAYLTSHPDVAAIVGNEVTTRKPQSTSRPWVQINQIDDAPVDGSHALRLVSVVLQLDCYAGSRKDGGQEEAKLLALTVRAALHAMPDATLSDAVVTGVTFPSMPRIRDTDFEPARERYALTAVVYAHAK